MKRGSGSLTNEEAAAVRYIAHTNEHQWTVFKGYIERQIERTRDRLEKPGEDIVALQAEVAALRRFKDLDESAKNILDKEKR